MATLPSLQAVVRSCATLLLGYGAAVAASIAVMVFVVLAVVVSEGGDGDPASELDVEAIGTLVGMPFQLAAMALGGQLHLGDGEFGLGLYAPPLLITAVFAVACFWWSRRSEGASPTSSLLERATLAVSGAFATAVVATAATRLLAMRDDGEAMHAASVGLFLGVLLVGAGSALLGRTAARGPLWPAWLPADGRRAAHLVTQHLLAWIVVLVPVATVWLLVESGPEAALYALIWGPTVALGGFGMGHLGAVTAAGESAFAWDLGWFPGVVLPLLALVLSVTAAVAWHLRRRDDRDWLVNPASWVALPVSYAVAALLVSMLSTITLSGAFYGVGGGVSFHVAYWLIPVLAVWGAAIEALSRFVAPALAAATPGPIARRLAKGPAQLVPPPTAPVQRIPMSPADRARAKRALIGIGVVGGLGLVGLVVFSIAGSVLSDPEKRAEAYLDALVEGDVEEAMRLAPTDADEALTDLLNNDVYGAADDRITGYEITDVDDGFGDTVTVTVDLEGVEDGRGVELTLEEDGRRALFFTDWKVAEGGLASELTVSVPEQSTSLEVNGVSVPAAAGEDMDLWALPGSYAINPYGESTWIAAADSVTTVPASSYGVYAKVASPEPSEELTAQVQTELEKWVNDCMTSEDLEPSGCPQSAFGYGDDVRKVRWTLTSMPTLSWDGFDGTFPVDLYADEEGEATVTYEYDASYGFGAPDWTAETSESSLYPQLTVDIVDDRPVVSFDTD